ncbi:sugar transferase [Streptomyces sp. MZ04]|uniref:sugar transferase n=1 Tax=Streptomyces sp. MZ04 TaxID=2559236 RepID=UPI00107ECB77|nr:sugar transferase [Streptomyces sp. MZ04]TGA95519.1 sugar transferase [Streptomyces sp. MZ04]
MSAERTVATPATQPRAADQAVVTASVVPPRAAGRSLRATIGLGSSVRRPAAFPLLAVDCAAALLGTLLLAGPQRHPLLVAVLVVGVTSLNTRAALYRRVAVPSVLDELPVLAWQIAVTWGAAGLLAASFSALDPVSATTLASAAALQCVLSCAGRGAVYLRARRAVLRQPRPALVVGPGGVARRVADAVLRHPQAGVRPVGIVAEAQGERTEAAEGAELPVLRTLEELRRAVIQNSVRTVLVVGPDPGPEQIGWLRSLSASGCDVWAVDATQPPGYDAPGRRYRSGRIAGFPCRPLAPAGQRHRSISKRALDLVTSGILLFLLSPVLLVCAAVLRSSDGPGVIFRQERVGRDGRPFTLLKFRTHRPADPHEAATRWTVAGEQHMSGFCQFLRRTSLDELPQLWNVLRGDMSLVGPRPERPYFVAKFSQAYPGYAERHRMPSGITGLAQIQGLRGDTSIEDRCRFDNAYIDSWSFWQDLCILLRTAASLVRPSGS